MENKQESLETLREIRTLMERSSRFMSLSGISGVVAGLAGIAGVIAIYLYFGLSPDKPAYWQYALDQNGALNSEALRFVMAVLLLVLLIAVLAAALLSARQARKTGLPVWNATSRRLIINMMIPLLAGGLYCLILCYHGHFALIMPSTLIFYGMALLNAGKYTINDIRYLGLLEIIAGLLASFFVDHGLLFWALGFGVLHIVYGLLMYKKYDT